MSDVTYDIFVVGGGINGCGIARDAAGRGFSVFLAEMDDLASGASALRRFNLRLMGLFGLLALGLAAIGLYGVIAYAVAQRRHEFGMLRAVGMQRSQIGRMVTIESVHIAVLGAVVGIISGVWLGWCFVRTLSDQGITRWAIPWDQMALIPVAAVAVGVVAAIWPARRAAQTSPLRAVE